jgi:hypothetical protein
MMSNPWYASPEGSDFMRRTLDGMFMFIWEAVDNEGTIYRQFDDIVFKRALSDPDYIVPEHLRATVDSLPKDKVVRFVLWPTALTKKVHAGRFNFAHVDIDLSKGERFISYWLTDQVIFPVPRVLRRTVIGKIFPDGRKTLCVISPSGATLLCDNDNQSYEGE